MPSGRGALRAAERAPLATRRRPHLAALLQRWHSRGCTLRRQGGGQQWPPDKPQRRLPSNKPCHPEVTGPLIRRGNTSPGRLSHGHDCTEDPANHRRGGCPNYHPHVEATGEGRTGPGHSVLCSVTQRLMATQRRATHTRGCAYAETFHQQLSPCKSTFSLKKIN